MSNRVLRWVVLGLLWATALSSIPAAGAAAGIAVIVLDETGVPVPGASVFLNGLTHPLHRVVETDAAGQAAFENLPDGQFTLAAEKDGFVRGVFGSASSSPPIPIAISQGIQFKATLVIRRPGAVAGVVSDEKGVPAQAEVRLLRYGGRSAARSVELVASRRTSSDGAFGFTSVDPGDYFVCARAVGMADAGTLVPVPACFGGSREPSGAAVVRVAPADVTGNVNVFLAYEPGARLQGKVLDANGQASVSTQVHIVRVVDDGFGITSLRTGSAGEFAATLLAGTFNLVVRGAGRLEVTLSAGTTTDVLFPLGRGANLSGRIAVAAPDTKPALGVGTTVFELVPAPSAFAHLMSAIPVRLTDADSLAFGAEGIPPGEYQLRWQAEVSGWLPASALSGDRDLLAEGVRILGTDHVADISLALVRADAELTGRVLDSNDSPQFDRTVLLFPADRRYWTAGSGRVRWAQPDTNGRFEITGLPAGQFLLAVTADAAASEWTPALLEAAAREALPISIERGQRVVQSVRIISR